MNRASHSRILVIMSLFMMTLLIGCKHTEDTDPDTDSAETQVALASKDAEILGDLRLYATTGRRATLPGIPQDDSEHAKTLCGVQYMVGTGDAISTTEQREKRKQLIHFMTSYNQVIFEMCKQQAK